MASIKRVVPLLLCAAILAPATLAEDVKNVAPDYTNVLVTIRTGTVTGGKRGPAKSYQVVALSHGSPVELVVGERIPIPVTTFQANTQPIIPVTSYTYQTVGFSATVEARVTGEGSIQIQLDLEESKRADTSAAQPTILTSHQKFQASLREREPLRLMLVEDPGGDSRYLEIEAQLMRR